MRNKKFLRKCLAANFPSALRSQLRAWQNISSSSRRHSWGENFPRNVIYSIFIVHRVEVAAGEMFKNKRDPITELTHTSRGRLRRRIRAKKIFENEKNSPRASQANFTFPPWEFPLEPTHDGVFPLFPSFLTCFRLNFYMWISHTHFSSIEHANRLSRDFESLRNSAAGTLERKFLAGLSIYVCIAMLLQFILSSIRTPYFISYSYWAGNCAELMSDGGGAR